MVAESAPIAAAAHVPRDAAIHLIWSEPMNRRAVERALLVAPAIRWARFSWDGSSLTLVPAESLAADRAHVVVVGRNARDRHGNLQGKSTVLAFTTGDSLPTGELRGRLEPLASTDVARVFAIRAGTDEEAAPSLENADAWSVAESDSGGTFLLRYLPPAMPAWVVSYVDRDAGGSFTPEAGDSWGWSAAPMVPAEQADREVVVTMMTPDREGMIRGQVSGATGQPRALVLASPVAESLKVRTAVPDSTTGRFMVAVPAGTYRVGVFRDLDANGVFDPEAHRALAPKDTAQAAGGDTIVVIDSIGAWDRIAVAESIVVPRPEAATITDTTAAVRDTSAAVRDTTGAPGDTTGAPRDSSAVTDSTALAEPLPPDVIEWGEGEIPLEPGEISPYLRLVAPPTGIVPDTSAVPPR